MSKIKLILFIVLVFLVGCENYESDAVDKTIDDYFTNIINEDYKESFEVVKFYTDEPNVLLAEEAFDVWLDRVEEARKSNTYITSYSVESIDVIKNEPFASSKVLLHLVENGIKNTRTIYLHLEKVDETWKIEGIWNENQEDPDELNAIFGGFIP